MEDLINLLADMDAESDRAIGQTGTFEARLSDGNRHILNLNAQVAGAVYINYDETETGARAVDTAILDAGAGIPYEEHEAFYNAKVKVAYPPGEEMPHVVRLIATAAFDTFGPTPIKQQEINALASPVVQQLATLKTRLTDPNNPDLTLTIDGPYFYPAPITLAETKFVSSPLDFQAAIDDLASGEHQIVLACLNRKTNNTVYLTIPAVTAENTPGTDDARAEFSDTDVADFDLLNNPTYTPSATIYLYYGQTEFAQADILKELDPRPHFPPPDAFLSIKHKWDATVNPDVTDDEDSGYSVGSKWYNLTGDAIWECIDASSGAAVWIDESSGGGSSPLTTKGDIYTYDTADTRLPVGTNNEVLTADSTQATGLIWKLLDLANSVAGKLGLANLATGATVGQALLAGVTDPAFGALDLAGGASIVTGILPDANISVALAGHTVTGGSINNTPVGTTTPAAGYFTTFKIKIGSIFATITHAFTADRSVTLPGDADVTLVGEATTQTLTNKTLTAPTIADFTNAQHDHLDADDGGTLSAAAIASGQLALAQGGTGSDLSATGPGIVVQASSGAAFTIRDDVGRAFANLIINSEFLFWQRSALKPTTLASISDGAYAADMWYILTAAASVQYQGLSSSPPTRSQWAGRLKQNNAIATFLGAAQPIEGIVTQGLRGKPVYFQLAVNISNGATIRWAILEHTGTQDSITKDVVNNWASGTYTPGNFFISSNLAVVATDHATPASNTWTTIGGTGSVGATANNLILFIWTEGAVAQNVTMDISQVWFGEGADAPVWMPIDPAADFIRCQRFLRVLNSPNTINQKLLHGHSISTTHSYFIYRPPTPFRIVPALTATAGDWDIFSTGASAVTAISILAASDESTVVIDATHAATTADAPFFFQGDAGGDRYLIMSAEL